jgi:diketogulonate reductase-like aldo/keto reductase
LRRAIELGASLVGTAEVCRTEEVVGKAVKGIRDQAFVVLFGGIRRSLLGHYH